jgi:uncharacterized protein (DUF697 family)
MGYLDTIRRVTAADFRDVSQEERDRAARDVIEMCSFACAGLVLQPVPVVEQAVVPVQLGMIAALSHVYGKELSRKKAREVILDLAAITGVSIVGRQALTTIAKVLLPGVGGVLGAPYAFSVTWGTGFAAVHYFRSGARPDKDKIREIFERERKRSAAVYSDDKARANRPSESDVERDVERE